MDESVFNSADREILRTLYSTGDALDVYVFYDRYNLIPSAILQSLRRFEGEGIIKLVGGSSLMLTEHGRRWVVAHRKRLFLRELDADWKEPPVSYLIDPLPTFAPYIPKRKNTSKKFFESLAIED